MNTPSFCWQAGMLLEDPTKRRVRLLLERDHYWLVYEEGIRTIQTLPVSSRWQPITTDPATSGCLLQEAQEVRADGAWFPCGLGIDHPDKIDYVVEAPSKGRQTLYASWGSAAQAAIVQARKKNGS